MGIGIGCAVLMGAYILHEFSFDKYHKNSQNLYRVVVDNNASGPYVWGQELKDNVPGINNVSRIYEYWNARVKLQDDFIKESGFILTEKDLFSMLDIPLLLGEKNDLLNTSTSIVISDLMRDKYFPDENPVGQILEVNLSGRIVKFVVTGVFQHFPSYSSIQADFIGSIDQAFLKMTHAASGIFDRTKEKDTNKLKSSWDEGGFQTLVLVNENANLNEIEKKGVKIYNKNRNKNYKARLQPLNDIYLYSNNISNKGPFLSSQLSALKIYAGIAILILLIACINYILLSLADAKKQLKQVAYHKIIGASAGHIQRKYLQQFLVIAMFSFIPALLFLSAIIPFFNIQFEKNLSIGLFLNLQYIALILSFIVFTALVAGLYVSIYAKRTNALTILSDKRIRAKNRINEKGLLVATQFVIFIFLVSSTIVMEKQIMFSTNKDHGFTTDNVLIFKLQNQNAQKNFNVLSQKINQNPHVLSVAGSSFTPPTQSFLQLSIANGEHEELKEEGLFIAPNLVSTLQIPIVEGNDFTHEDINNISSFIINESAAKKYDVKAGEYLGKYLIQAVVKDFHAHSLHRHIKPLLLINSGNENSTQLVVRTNGNDREVIKYVQNLWAEVLPYSILEYETLSDRIADFYKKEKVQTQSVMFFSFMAVILAFMGLLGFVSLMLIQKTKEIGIRKVNGAKVTEVLAMLNKDFVKWVAIAFVIACPIAYYAMNKWLENFAYKTTLSWWIFALAGVLALGIALLTVSWQSWRAATRNPVEALRYE